MRLCDCVSKISSQTELLLFFSEAAYEAAKNERDRMTQAVLPINTSFLLEEELIDALGNDDCKSLIAAIGVGIVLGGTYTPSERMFDITKLRYGKIIVVTERGELARSASNEVLRFFFRHMRPLIDGGKVFVLETPLEKMFTQNELFEHVLNSGTRRLRIVTC